MSCRLVKENEKREDDEGRLQNVHLFWGCISASSAFYLEDQKLTQRSRRRRGHRESVLFLNLLNRGNDFAFTSFNNREVDFVADFKVVEE